MAKNPPGYLCMETERYSCCDGHWKCYCPEEKTLIIAGIGSRETPSHIMDMMTFIGVWCRENGHWVRSGHADGADWAFEVGAQENCIAYVPWERFNAHLVSRAHKRVGKPTCHTIAITKKFHPAFDKLSYGALSMMCRNASQVLGEDLDSPVDAVVCWTKDGKDSGGTGQAVRIAWDRQIPVLNMYLPEYSDDRKVCDYLQGLVTPSGT